MFTACELGVFDLLLESEGPLSSDAIAERLGASTNGMEQLLNACVGLKLLGVEIRSEGGKDVICRTPDPLSSLFLKICLIFAFFHHRGTLPHNCHAFPKIMANGSEIISAISLKGASGLAQECISLHPNSTATIFDLPTVEQMAKEHYVPTEERRITFHEGDFLKDPVPEADLYILARALHLWEDDKCLQLLEKVHKTCKPGGGVLVVESFLNEDKTGFPGAQLSSMMLVQTEGKERTPTEYNKLLTAAGFREIQVKKTGKLYDAILGRK
uniref:Acetylserotonin O-methyltransferase n=1 Tax=Pelusios castaneus TaxID=367368 RepID=A0A8C8RWF7_9SAUR